MRQSRLHSFLRWIRKRQQTRSTAILYKQGNSRTIQAYISTADKHNTYKAEIIGAILTTWLIHNTPETLGKMISLYTNNQSIIAALTSHESATSHSKVKGNEDIDKTVKEAATGHSSTMVDLPIILRNSLPINTSAIKQEFTAKLKIK